MNRQALLEMIRRHIRQSGVDDGDMRPLGEVVAGVLSDMEATNSRDSISSTAAVVPVEMVAAFIDGDLNEAESKFVVQAALADRSVVAELIAAIRAIEHDSRFLQSQIETADLNERLLQMGSSLAGTSARPPSQESPLPAPNDKANATDEPIVKVRAHGKQHTKRRKRKSAPFAWIGLASAVAASIALAFYLNRPNTDAPKENVVVAPDRNLVDPNITVPDPDPSSGLDVPDSNDRPDASPMIVRQPTPVPKLVPDSSVDKDPVVAVDSIPVKPNPTPIPIDNEPKPAEFAALTWKRVSGVLAEEQTRQVSSGARGTTTRFRSLDVDAVSRISPLSSRVTLRTLPLSRAEANVDGGGKLVLRGESSAALTQAEQASVVLNLQHGAIAMLDLPRNTVVRLQSENADFGRLRVAKANTRIVAEHSKSGFLLHVHGEGVALNGRTISPSSLLLKQNQPAEPMAKLQRIPTWTTRATESVTIPRSILAQIRSSNDLLPEISRHVSTLTRKGNLSAKETKLLEILARWQIGLAETNLVRFAGVQSPVVRFTALKLLAEMPDWDPRYDAIWASVSRMVADQARTDRLQRLCETIRDGRVPNDAQIDQLAGSISSQRLGIRSLSDYLLRRFCGGSGPRFDPTTKNRTMLVQGVTDWRRFLAARRRARDR